MTSAPRTLEFFFFDAGGGHRSAALALSEVIAERYPGWNIQLVNLQEILGPVDMFQKVTGLQSQDFYNAILKRGWTFGSKAMLRTLQRGIRYYAPNFEDVLEKHWQVSKPDIVVSLIPNFNLILFQATQDRCAARVALGLDPNLPTALIMFGGYGSRTAEKIVKRLGRAGIPLQTIVICGHNEKLCEALKGRPGCHAVGFTDRVPDYMRMADFFIGKPGPGSISEALHMGLPVILERNNLTMPQERYNTDWVRDHELGVIIRDFRRIAEAVRLLLTDGRLEQFRDNASRLDNRAVYEIPAMLDRIIAEAARSMELTA